MSLTFSVDADPEPPARPPADDLGSARSVARRALLAAVLVGVALDLVVHQGIDGVSGAVLAVVLATTAIRALRRPTSATIAGAVLVAGVGAGTALHTSTWVVLVDWTVVGVTLPLLGGLASGRSPVHTRFVDALSSTTRWASHVVRAPLALGRLLAGLLPARSPERRARSLALVRGVLIAAPIVVATTALLASGDAVFASFLHVPFSVGGALGHLGLIVAGTWLGVVLLLQARDRVTDLEVRAPLQGGATELTIVLGALDVVFALFAAARSVALFRGSDYVQRTTHLTYADYARSGFFQLLAVAAIAAIVLLAVVGTTSRVEGRPRRRLTALGEIGVILTLVIVAAALRRLDLYQDRFGLTMLRLACTWTAWWLGAVFVIIGVAVAGVGRRNAWLTPVLVGALLVGVIAANLRDPAGVVAATNVGRIRAQASSEVRSGPDGLDVDYLISLGDDAQPVLLAHLDDMPAGARAKVVDQVCRAPHPARGLLDANRSASAAAAARARFCPAS